MNAQEAFDKAAKHLLAQGCKSEGNDAEGTCLYRGPNGTMCAVGCLIPDELYQSSFEAKRVEALCRVGAPLADLFKGVPTTLLGALQSIHDQHPVKDWPKHLAGVAHQFGLSDEVLQS